MIFTVHAVNRWFLRWSSVYSSFSHWLLFCVKFFFMYFCVQRVPRALLSRNAVPLCYNILSPRSFALSAHSLYCISLLTLNWPGWYLNFGAWFMWGMWQLFEQKKIKLWNKRHFVENNTVYASGLKNAVYFLVS